METNNLAHAPVAPFSARGRGRGWRPRSRYAARGFNSNGRQSTSYESAIQRPPSPPLGPLLQSLSETDLVAADETQSSRRILAEITNCAYVASFNWLDRNEPTILIPGMDFRTSPIIHLARSAAQCNVDSLTLRMM